MLRADQALTDLRAVFPRRKQRYTEEVQKHGRQELRLPLNRPVISKRARTPHSNRVERKRHPIRLDFHVESTNNHRFGNPFDRRRDRVTFNDEEPNV